MTNLRRALDRRFEWLSVRPLSLLVFLASLALLMYLQTRSAGHFRTPAIAHANTVEHPALVSSFVSSVYVHPGDRVNVGTPLLELSSYFIERDLERLNAEIEQVLRESKLAQARLLIEEERFLAPAFRLRPNRPSIQAPTDELYAAQLTGLHTRRSQLLEVRDNLTITSRSPGRIALVAIPGSSVAAGTSVAAVTPEYAEEIIAYAPPDTDPLQVEPGTSVRIVKPLAMCTGHGTVLRRGARVEAAPAQLGSFFRPRAHGLPIYISVPAECRLAVGQALSVEFARARM